MLHVCCIFPERRELLSTIGKGTHLMAALSRKLSCGITRVSGDDKYRSNWTCCLCKRVMSRWWVSEWECIDSCREICLVNTQCNSPWLLSQKSCPCWGGGTEDPKTDRQGNISSGSNSKSQCFNSNNVESPNRTQIKWPRSFNHSGLQAVLKRFLPFCLHCTSAATKNG